jgi:cytoskeletal protein CcmA (bactofilin family)
MWKPDQHKIPAPAKSADEDALVPLPELDIPEGVTSLGRTIAVTGVLHAAEHLIIEGKFKGELTILDHGLAVGKHATVDAQVMARTISVRGRTTGTLTASEKVEIHLGGNVEGRIVTTRLAIEEGALFNGSVDPKRTEAALAVHRHRLKQQG